MLLARRYYCLILVCCCFCLPKILQAQTVSEESKTAFDLNASLYYLSNEGDLGIDEIASLSLDKFQQYSSLPKGGKLIGNDYWLRLDIKQAIDTQSPLVLVLGAVDHATLYLPTPDGSWQKSLAGWITPRSLKNFREGVFWESDFKIQILKEGPQQWFVHITQPTQSPIKLEASLRTYPEWKIDHLTSTSDFKLLMGVVIGFLGIMFLYNILIGVFSKKRIYIYYALYILGGFIYVIFYGAFLSETWLAEYPKLFVIIRNIVPAIGFIGYILFVKSFLDTKDNFPVWDKIFTGFIVIMTINTLLILIITPFSLNESYTRRPIALSHMLSQATFMVFVIQIFFKRNKLYIYFAIGASFFILASIFLGYSVATGAFSLQTALSVEFTGLAGELIAFSLGLGYKIRLTEQEKIRAQEAMANLLQEQNATLERKVKERTQELEFKSEEILTQNEELQQQHEEIVSQRDYIESQNVDLIHKNEQITASIRYAQTIQQTILPFSERLDSAFQDHFIHYQPKDIVSGDFYWYEAVNDTKLIAVLDCTGHGVPGGFMSMMGFSILNDIALKEQLTDPAQILERTNATLMRMLQQNQEDGKVQDGMDVVLCAIKEINSDTMEVTFCGAKRPLYYKGADHSELTTINGDRKSIGGYQPTGKMFTNEVLVLPKKTALYLTTDGLIDQHNMKGRKYGSAKFKAWLNEQAHLPMKQQGELLKKELSNYRQGQIQRDDITILGIRL